MEFSTRPRARLLAGLAIFTGLGAISPGWSMISDPSGASMGWTPELLQRGPFRSFLVPGLFLLGVNGLGQLALTAGALGRRRWAGPAGLGLGAALAIWICVQIAVIGPNSWLQPAFLAVGLGEMGLAWRLERRWRVG